MSFCLRQCLASAALCAAILLPALPQAFAQSGDAKSNEKAAQAAPADPAKEGQRRRDEFAEAASAVNGEAGNPECVWLGRRVVGLLWRDDVDTAFRHLDLYDRFGCPGGHVQATFRCVIKQGSIDPKAPESVSSRVHACWLNPVAATAPATSAAAPASAPATPENSSAPGNKP